MATKPNPLVAEELRQLHEQSARKDDVEALAERMRQEQPFTPAPAECAWESAASDEDFED